MKLSGQLYNVSNDYSKNDVNATISAQLELCVMHFTLWNYVIPMIAFHGVESIDICLCYISDYVVGSYLMKWLVVGITQGQPIIIKQYLTNGK